jgi:hypothetical protein
MATSKNKGHGKLTVVKSSIDLVHHKEGSRVKGMNGKQKRQRSHRLFTSTELLHITESLHRRHGVEFQSTLVGFLRVIQAQIRVPSKRMFATLCHISVDSLEGFIDMIECIKESLRTLVLDSLKFCSGLLGIFLGRVKISAGVFEFQCNRSERFLGLISRKISA